MELLILTIVVLLVVIVVQWARFNDVVTRQQKEITDPRIKISSCRYGAWDN